ncbi:MAG TPA: hypothetical protein PK239_02350 [Chitinophagales bacterium]|nr:hypothetical protein [Chitinophagales bacterium]HRK26109.1 hypothetical protein [Chitinophagales bacterium]
MFHKSIGQFIAVLWLGWLATGCTLPNNKPDAPTQANNEPTVSQNQTTPSPPDSAAVQKEVLERANEALTLLTNNQTQQLATLVHQVKGVRFSPYAYVQPDKDRVFTANEVAALATNKQLFLWGEYDGSGDPIRLSFSDYRKKFITDKDYLNQSDSIGFNQIIGTGNSLNNRTEVYANAQMVEYYQSGKHPDYGGMDWGSLTLAFEQHNGQWYLVAVIHNCWTI